MSSADGRRARDVPLLQPRGVAEAAGLAASCSATCRPDGAATAAAADPAGNGLHVRLPALANEFNYEPPVLRPLPPALRWLRLRMFRLFLATLFLGTPAALAALYFRYDERNDTLLWLPCDKEWKDLVKYLSIPVVSVLFTWWHVWLGIQMCFYPVYFRGCCPPYLGWQGIVPRRAEIMASRSCDIMIGSLITVEEIVDRIRAEEFFSTLQPQLSQTISVVSGQIAEKHFPSVWRNLPEWSKEEIQQCVWQDSQRMFDPVIRDLKGNINQIVDFKQMAIEVLCEDKKLLVEMFMKIGRREFVFIQHLSAFMGFVLGVIQMLLWIGLNAGGEGCKGADSHSFRCWGGFVVLPISGLLIGYLTNWLGITLIFRPVMPKIVCGGYINIQGVFLKRQQEVSKELADTICQHLVCARRMVEYIVKKEEIMNKILQIYEGRVNEQITKAISIVPVAREALGRLVGIEGIREDVVKFTLRELPNHATEIEDYMDSAFNLAETIGKRLCRLNPKRFEMMLHPVFQEDEWMVLLLGGVLGVVVGTLQAFALGS